MTSTNQSAPPIAVQARRTESSSTVARMAAIARRDLAIQLTYHFQLAVRFAQTLFMTIVMYFVAKLVHDPAKLGRYDGHYFEFVIIGMIVTSLISVGLGAFSQSISDEQSGGTLEMLLASPTPVSTLLAGSLIVPLGMSLVQVSITLLMASVVFGANIFAPGLWLAALILLLIMATFCAFGIFSACFVVLTKRGDPITVFAAQATTLLAGTLFPTTVLPGPVQAITRAIPAYYGLQALRAVLLNRAGLGDIARDALILVAFTAAMLPVATWCFARALRAARVAGTLGNY